jgi:threonine/homoserine/homoserine lactone efflux protein
MRAMPVDQGLLYLGVQAIRKRHSFNLDENAGVRGITGRRAYASGLVTNLLNPPNRVRFCGHPLVATVARR